MAIPHEGLFGEAPDLEGKSGSGSRRHSAEEDSEDRKILAQACVSSGEDNAAVNFATSASRLGLNEEAIRAEYGDAGGEMYARGNRIIKEERMRARGKRVSAGTPETEMGERGPEQAGGLGGAAAEREEEKLTLTGDWIPFAEAVRGYALARCGIADSEVLARVGIDYSRASRGDGGMIYTLAAGVAESRISPVREELRVDKGDAEYDTAGSQRMSLVARGLVGYLSDARLDARMEGMSCTNDIGRVEVVVRKNTIPI